MNELIKALRNCACVTENATCADCEYYKKQLCKRSLMIDSADAIERLTAEIDRKDKAIQGLLTQIEKLQREASNEQQS